MNQVLLVDDEPSLILTLQAGFQSYSDRFKVLTAPNGREALEILERHRVDLLVTDLRMPEMDGFALISHLAADYPGIPVIVMTAYATPENEKRLQQMNALRLIEKPVDFDELIQAILDTLDLKGRGGFLNGISIANFLELIEREEKTCLLELSREDRILGLVFCHRGQVWDAAYQGCKGEEAIFGMLGLENVRISFRNLPNRKVKRRIKKSLMALLVETARRADEKAEASEQQDALEDLSGEPSVPVEPVSFSAELPDLKPEPDDRLQQPGPDTDWKGEYDMSQIEDALAKFREVEGFNAVGVFSPQGEMLAEVNGSGLKMDELGALANDVLLKAQKVTEIMGVGRGQTVQIEAPKANLVARCLNEANEFSETTAGHAHLHMVLAMSKEGNLGMAKIRMNSIIQELAPMFR